MLTLKYQSTQRGPIYYFHVESSANFLSKDLTLIAYPKAEKSLAHNFTHLTSEQLSSIKFVPGVILNASTKPGFTLLGATFTDNTMSLLRDQDITITLLKSNHFGMSSLHGDYMAIAHFYAHIEHSDVAICSPDSKSSQLAAFEFKECKFDTLTFEQLGEIVRFPTKRMSTYGTQTSKRSYDNIEENDLLDYDIKPPSEYTSTYTHVFDTPVSNKHKDVMCIQNTLLNNYNGKHKYHTKQEVVFDITPLLENSFDHSSECAFPENVFETDIVFVELPSKK